MIFFDSGGPESSQGSPAGTRLIGLSVLCSQPVCLCVFVVEEQRASGHLMASRGLGHAVEQRGAKPYECVIDSSQSSHPLTPVGWGIMGLEVHTC